MKLDRTTSLILVAIGAALLSFLVGWLTSSAPSAPQKAPSPTERPAGPCGPDTLPDRGVCIPVASPGAVRTEPNSRP